MSDERLAFGDVVQRALRVVNYSLMHGVEETPQVSIALKVLTIAKGVKSIGLGDPREEAGADPGGAGHDPDGEMGLDSGDILPRVKDRFTGAT